MGFSTEVDESGNKRRDAFQDGGDMVKGGFEQILEYNTSIKHMGGAPPDPLTLAPSNDLLGGATMMPIIAGAMMYDMVAKRFRR